MTSFAVLPSDRPRWTRYAGEFLALAALYAGGGLLALHFIYPETPSFFWFPFGLALGVLTRFGVKYVPGVWIGSFAVSLYSHHWLLAAILASINAAAVTVAACGLRRFRFDSRFTSQRDVLLFVGWGVLVAPLLAGGCGTVQSLARGIIEPAAAGTKLFMWWLGDAVGVMVAAPVVFAADRGSVRRFADPSVRARLAISLLTLILAGHLAFGPVRGDFPYRVALGFVPLVLVCRSALLFGRLAVLDVLFLAVAATLGLAFDWITLPLPDRKASQVLVAAYLMTAGVLQLLVVALSAERDAAEHSRRTSDAEYRALVEDNPAMICRFRPDGTLTFCNATYRAAFGESIAGRPIFLPTAEAVDRAAVLKGFRSLDMAAPPATAECPVRDFAGTVRWQRWTARAVDLASGEVTEFHAVGLDVTDQKAAEAETRLFAAQMVQTQKLESIGVLAGGVAHEFNNLLTGILGNAELLRFDSLVKSPVAEESVAAITSAAERAAHLTKQLLVYAGKGPTPSGVVHLSELVRASEELVSVSIPKRCPVRYELAEGLPPVLADEADVRQVLVNLVTNAGEAVAGDGGRVTVRTGRAFVDPADPTDPTTWSFEPELPVGEYVLLQVTDDGPGMSPDVFARAFEPFFTTKFPGRGLGLPAVLGIVRTHRGAVRLTSAPGHGTTVSVLLPPATLARPTHTPPESSARWVVPPEVRNLMNPRR